MQESPAAWPITVCRTPNATTFADDRQYVLYTVAVRTGMRPGEMLAHRWTDVDLEAGTVQINRALSEGEIAAPKTFWSRRRITLSPTIVAVLKVHRKRQLEELLSKAGL